MITRPTDRQRIARLERQMLTLRKQNKGLRIAVADQRAIAHEVLNGFARELVNMQRGLVQVARGLAIQATLNPDIEPAPPAAPGLH